MSDILNSNIIFVFTDELKKLLSNVNWARAGLGLPLLEEQTEKRPTFHAIPSGPRPPPEGQSLSTGGCMSDGIQSAGLNSIPSGTYPVSRIRKCGTPLLGYNLVTKLVSNIDRIVNFFNNQGIIKLEQELDLDLMSQWKM